MHASGAANIGQQIVAQQVAKLMGTCETHSLQDLSMTMYHTGGIAAPPAGDGQDSGPAAMDASASNVSATIVDGVPAPQLVIGGVIVNGVKLMAQTVTGITDSNKIRSQNGFIANLLLIFGANTGWQSLAEAQHIVTACFTADRGCFQGWKVEVLPHAS